MNTSFYKGVNIYGFLQDTLPTYPEELPSNISRMSSALSSPIPVHVSVRLQVYSARCLIVRVHAARPPWIQRCFDNGTVENPLQFPQARKQLMKYFPLNHLLNSMIYTLFAPYIAGHALIRTYLLSKALKTMLAFFSKIYFSYFCTHTKIVEPLELETFRMSSKTFPYHSVQIFLPPILLNGDCYHNLSSCVMAIVI